MKKVVIYMEGAQENEKALSMAYAAERAINETYGIRGMVYIFAYFIRNRPERPFSL